MKYRRLRIFLAGLLAFEAALVAAPRTTAASPSAEPDTGGALVPYKPPTGQYVDPTPFLSVMPANPVPRMVTAGPDPNAPKGFVEGRSKEMPLARTENRKVFANPDGTFTALVYGAPINWKAGEHDWRPIDNRIVGAPGGGHQNASGPLSVRFAANSAPGALVRIGSGATSIAFHTPAGAQRVVPKVDGSSVTYANVLPNVDLQYRVEGRKVKEQIVLHRPPPAGAPTRFVFPMEAGGLRAVTEPVQLPGGSAPGEAETTIKLLQGSDPVFEIPPGVMYDSGLHPERGDSASAPVRISLDQTAGAALIVEADTAWLRDPDREYPVFIDPTVVNRYGSGDAYVLTYYPNQNRDVYWNAALNYYEDNAGYYDTSTGTQHTYMTYDLSSFMNQRIISATWNVYFIWSYYVSSYTNYWIRPVNGAWAANTITWNNQPPRRSEYIADSAVRNVWRTVDMTSWVQNWTNGTWPNHGIEIDMNGNGQTHWKKMAAHENGPGGNASYLRIDYEGYSTSYGFANSDNDPPDDSSHPSYRGPAPNTAATLKVYVTNNGTDPWPANGIYRLSYHLRRRDGTLVTWDGPRTQMPVAVNPGTGIWLDANVDPIAAAGSYTLEWDMVQEGVTWFSNRGVQPGNFLVFVAAAPAPQTPADQAVIVNAERDTLSVTLTATASSTSATSHRFQISPGSNFGEILVASPNFTPAPGASFSWTVPPGALKDGARYYWTAVANDGVASSAAITRTFDMDSYQLGQRPAWPFDSTDLGAANARVNLATGNLVLDIPGISLPTVSQPLSTGVAYNGHAALVGAYVTDRTPFGAGTDEGFSANWDQGRRFMGKASVVVPVGAGTHQVFFANAAETYAVPQNSTLEAFVYVDPANPPQEVMLQFHLKNGDWDHRAFWGADLIPFGTPGTGSRRQVSSSVPASGRWVRLTVRAADVGLALSGTQFIDGVAFTLYGGRAWFDHVGLADSRLGAGFQLGNHLEHGDLSAKRLIPLDLGGTPVFAGNGTRIDRVEVRETDGATWVFRNRAPPAPAPPQPWPQFDAPPGVMSQLSKNADDTWSMSGADGLNYDFGGDGTIRTVDVGENRGTQPGFRYTFDPNFHPARLIEIKDPLDRVATVSYGSTGRVSSLRTWDGRSVSFGYDADTARLLTITNPAGRTTTIAYRDLDGTGTAGQIAGMVLALTNPRGKVTTFGYGDGSAGKPVDRVVQVTEPAPTSPITRYTYNPGSTDVVGPRCPANCPNGYSQRVLYDGRNRATQSLDALGNASHAAYDNAERTLLSVDRTGLRTDSTYDSEGRPVATQSALELQRYGAGLYAEYHDNADLSGRPRVTRTDGTVDFNWASGSPDAQLPTDAFSVRWTGYLSVPQAGSYTLYTNSDDGTRLRVGSSLAIDDWTTRSLAERSATLTLPAGEVRVSLEYFDSSGAAEAHLSWSGPGIAKQIVPAANLIAAKFATSRAVYDEGLGGLRAAYFENKDLAGRPKLLRTDAPTGTFAFNWGAGAPSGLTSVDNFSVRWSGRLIAPTSGTYKFGAAFDDGVRVYVDGSLVVDRWPPNPAMQEPDVVLAQGPHRLVVEYYEAAGSAAITLRWKKPADADLVDLPTSALTPNYGLVTSSIDEAGNTTTHSYTGGGTDASRGLKTDSTIVNTDADGNTQTYRTSTAYDSLGRVTSTTSPKGMPTGTPDPNYTRTQTYFGSGPALGLLESVTVPGRGTTSYSYEAPQTGGTHSSGRVIQRVEPGSRTWTYAYDAVGNQTAVTPPGRSQPTVKVYDEHSNVTRISDPQGGTITFSYDELDRLATTNTYDALYGAPGGQDTPSATDSATYDLDANVVTRTDAAGTLSYVYDARGLVTSVTDPASRVLSYTYDAAGRITNKTLPNGTLVRHTYDAAGRLSQLQNRRAGPPETTLADYTATYDARSKIATLATPEGTHQYTYDTLGRLERWTEPNATRHRYFFDLDHNRIQKTVNDAITQTLSYAPNATDRLESVNGGAAYTYGFAGEVLARPGQTLEWEEFGNLKKVTLSSGASVSFDRDALGRVRQRTERDASNAIVSDVRYRFNGSSDAPAYETNAAGTVILKSHLAGPDGLTITYAGNRSGTASFSYSDIHGNVAFIADATGTITAGPFSYDPFGNVIGAQVPTPYGFVGKWQKQSDPLAGLVLMGARPYDPVLGRFLSVDPVPGGSANDYDYAFQDAVNLYDLDGRCVACISRLRQLVRQLTRSAAARSSASILERYAAQRSRTPELIRELKESVATNNGVWRLVARLEEQSVSFARGYRGGRSVEEVYERASTGERMARHFVHNEGRVVHETWRPQIKFHWGGIT